MEDYTVIAMMMKHKLSETTARKCFIYPDKIIYFESYQIMNMVFNKFKKMNKIPCPKLTQLKLGSNFCIVYI